MREPRLVRRRVSGETPTVNWVGVKEVMVRHVPGLRRSVSAIRVFGIERSRMGRKRSLVDREWSGVPFILMLSPKWASVRISAQSEIVSEVPPPPAAESSCFSRRVTAGWVSLAETDADLRKGVSTACDFNYACEHV